MKQIGAIGGVSSKVYLPFLGIPVIPSLYAACIKLPSSVSVSVVADNF